MYIMSLAESYYCILEYVMFTLLLLLCIIYGLETMSTLTQLQTRRLVSDRSSQLTDGLSQAFILQSLVTFTMVPV